MCGRVLPTSIKTDCRALPRRAGCNAPAKTAAKLGAPWVLHDCRRTAASGMARLGVPPHVVEAVLNHKSGQVRGVAAVYNRYSYAAEKREALALWAEHAERCARNIIVARPVEAEAVAEAA
jgi:integrase